MPDLPATTSASDVDEPVEYLDVTAVDLPAPPAPWTRWQTFYMGIMVGVTLMIAAAVYLGPRARQIPPEGIPIKAVNGAISRVYP